MLFYYYTNLIWEGFLMYQSAKQPKKLKIAYIGGGSRGWAWTLIFTGTVSEVEAAMRAIMQFAEEKLGFSVCAITKT